MFKHLIFPAFAACIASGVNAHEFWIDPEAHMVAPDAPVVARLRVGQEYVGGSMSYIPQRTRQFDVVVGGEMTEVAARMGDNPAFAQNFSDEGLVTIVHVTGDSFITWDDFSDFESFVVHKDAEWTLEEHETRGLSRDDVTEVYSRYAKSLVAVGDGSGRDVEVGLLTEITALENPYTGETSDGIDVRLTYEGQARGDEQIEVFEKAPDETVAIFTVRTDADGVVSVPVKPGHRYMLDAVVLREPGPEVDADRGAVWESLWANLTFMVP